MSLITFRDQLRSYMQADYETRVLIDAEVNAVRYNEQPISESNAHYYRTMVEETPGFQSPTASTDAVYSQFTADQGITVVKRGGLYKKVGAFEAARDGFMYSAEEVSTLFTNHFYMSAEQYLFKSVVKGAFNAVNGSLTGSHMIDKSTSAFDWDYVMQAIYLTGTPSKFKYAFIHPTVLSNYGMYNYLDTTDVTLTTPIRPFANAKLVGMKDGIVIYSSDDLNLASSVYDTVIMGDNSLYVDMQMNPNVNVYADPKLEGGSTLAQYNIALAAGIIGLTFAGSIPTTIAGVTDTVVETGASWTKLANLRDDQIGITAVKSLK